MKGTVERCGVLLAWRWWPGTSAESPSCASRPPGALLPLYHHGRRHQVVPTEHPGLDLPHSEAPPQGPVLHPWPATSPAKGHPLRVAGLTGQPVGQGLGSDAEEMQIIPDVTLLRR